MIWSPSILKFFLASWRLEGKLYPILTWKSVICSSKILCWANPVNKITRGNIAWTHFSLWVTPKRDIVYILQPWKQCWFVNQVKSTVDFFSFNPVSFCYGGFAYNLFHFSQDLKGSLWTETISQTFLDVVFVWILRHMLRYSPERPPLGLVRCFFMIIPGLWFEELAFPIAFLFLNLNFFF